MGHKYDEDEVLEMMKELDPGEYHFIPEVVDIEKHVESITCWCQPKLAYRNIHDQVTAYIHKYALENPN